jgi:hypothetical protein
MLCGCSPSHNDANFFSLLYIIQRTSLYIMWATPIFDWKLVDIYTDGNVNKGSESIELLGSYTHSGTAALQSIICAAVCCSRAAAAAATHILCIERAGDESIRQIDMCVNAGMECCYIASSFSSSCTQAKCKSQVLRYLPYTLAPTHPTLIAPFLFLYIYAPRWFHAPFRSPRLYNSLSSSKCHPFHPRSSK